MLNSFQLGNHRLSRLDANKQGSLPEAVWVDLIEPGDAEREWVQHELGQRLKTPLKLENIEASARFFEDEDGVHIHSFFFYAEAEDHAGNASVAFTIRDGQLYTLRERKLQAFRL